MMRARPCVTAFTVVLCMSAGGCSSVPGTGEQGISASLVMPQAGRSRLAEAPPFAGGGDASAWEYGRNDARLNVSAPAVQRIEWSEIWNRNRTFTNNGRPGEYSSRFVRTYTLQQSN
jgi:hypothetical protein